jgi:hypothetical protein
MYTINLEAKTPVMKRVNRKHDWIIAFRVDGRLIQQIAHQKGAIRIKCSTMHSEEENGEISEGRLAFGKVVSLTLLS